MKDIKINSKVVIVPIGEIKPYEGSHKTLGSLEMIKESIKRYGITQPISIDADKVIVTGNGVYRAAVELGYNELPCIVVDYLSPEKVSEYRMADNLTGGFARWNEDKLKRELSYLQSPEEMQVFFDDSIRSMLSSDDSARVAKSMDSSVHGTPGVSPAVRNSDEILSVELKKDNDFKNDLKNVENDMEAKSVEYFKYRCSKCGKDVIVRLK